MFVNTPPLAVLAQMGERGEHRVMDVADRLEIHELISRYGHLIDDRSWDRIGDVFTSDAHYDMTDFDMGTAVGHEAIVEMWTGPQADHPLAHHASNVVVDVEPDGTVRVTSKGIGVGARGRVGSVTYHDVVTKTDDGWRIARRTGILRRPQDF